MLKCPMCGATKYLRKSYGFYMDAWYGHHKVTFVHCRNCKTKWKEKEE